MHTTGHDPASIDPTTSGSEYLANLRHQAALLKAGALQSAIFNSAYFSCIATDATGVIQIFNVGAERMLGYNAVDVLNETTPADISDPQELIARAAALSIELDTPIAPGFEALVFKASRGIEDIYELTYVRKDGSRLPAVVSVTALRDAQESIIGYLLIGTDNTARKQAEATLRSAAKFREVRGNVHSFRRLPGRTRSLGERGNPDDMLLWADGFWCFREELRNDSMRDENYRVVVYQSDEWTKIYNGKPFSSRPT